MWRLTYYLTPLLAAGCAAVGRQAEVTLGPRADVVATSQPMVQTGNLVAAAAQFDRLCNALADLTLQMNTSATVAASATAQLETTIAAVAVHTEDASRNSHNVTNDVRPWLVTGVVLASLMAVTIIVILWIQWAKLRHVRQKGG